MYLLIFAAVIFVPVLALVALLAFVLVRIDCYGGVRIMGLRVASGPRKWVIVAREIAHPLRA